MKVSGRTGLFCALLAMLGLGLVSPSAAREDTGEGVSREPALLLGYELPLTGANAAYGRVFQEAARLQLDRFNAAGGVAGRPVEILYADSRDDADQARTIARAFVDDPRVVGVLGDFSSTVSMAAGSIYGKEGIPQLSPTAAHPDYIKISPWQFRAITTPAFEGPNNAAWMIGDGFTSVAVIGVTTDWGLASAQAFRKAFELRGGAVVVNEEVPPGNRRFDDVIDEIEDEAPQAIYLAMAYEDAAPFLRALRARGSALPVYGSSALYSPKFIDLGGAAVEGVRLATAFVLGASDPVVVAFVSAYENLYGAIPTLFAAHGYDAVGIMLAAVGRAGPEVTRESLREALAATDRYAGVTGITRFDPETRETTKILTRLVVREGDFRVIDRSDFSPVLP
ncbi:amino acid ABC transporter substrate-binding protein [Rhodospirillum rubrum]|uniref:ABC transporter substrate-binding protein n=1 Tax=Rhodospirillum rubrum TaxID=1085 RepID=UPI0019073FCC|nr:ABC transporter substrate-binding protein [Rhodospirillum rubrum]MBK1663869.1 amino acid ABC transporter substrate-binding protein [Rhodospirillum rubrum]MBK1675887.1 amino acid ABC transporter substrate-binding protein [Rhodospirillum rubrum]